MHLHIVSVPRESFTCHYPASNDTTDYKYAVIYEYRGMLTDGVRNNDIYQTGLLIGLFSLGHFFSHFYDTTPNFCKMVIPDSRKNIKLIKVPEDHALF